MRRASPGLPKVALVSDDPTRTRTVGSPRMSATGMPRWGGAGGRLGVAVGVAPGRRAVPVDDLEVEPGVSSVAGQAVGDVGCGVVWATQPVPPKVSAAATKAESRGWAVGRQGCDVIVKRETMAPV